jgi:hypothetical protein
VGEPITGQKDLEKINKFTNSRLDAWYLQSAIYNGNLELLDPTVVTDFQLGVLSAADLRLLRNLLAASHGYIFSSKDLDEHFRKFPWYTPKETNIDSLLTPAEKALIVRIKRFENQPQGKQTATRKEIVGTWKEFNGGADQAGAIFVLSQDGQFKYTFREWFMQRTATLSGTWTYVDSRIVLDIAKQDLTLGGYYVQQPDDIVIENPIHAEIRYDHSLVVRLPVTVSVGIPGYEDNAKFTWKEIGTDVFYAD